MRGGHNAAWVEILFACHSARVAFHSAAMLRPNFWLVLVVLLLGVIFLREPRLQRSEEFFLKWLMQNSSPLGSRAPLTVVEINRDTLMDRAAAKPAAGTEGSAVSPLELALFLQSTLEFQPTVIAFENILGWRERDKEQEQIFIDQAMRVPRLLLAAELTTTPDPDATGGEIRGFNQVTGKRGELVEFSSIGRQPPEDLRLIATAGFTNLPEEVADATHVPLLFRYRGEVIPSFALEAILLWLRVTPGEVKIDLGRQITLPQGRTIPIRNDGTVTISPNAAKRARHLSLNELLLAAQQHDTGKEPNSQLAGIHDEIILARLPGHPMSPPDIFAATLATIQTNAYVHRVSWIFDCVILALLAGLSVVLRNISRADLLLLAIGITAAYCLIALAIVSRWLIWLPGILPLGVLWLLVLLALVSARRQRTQRADITAIPPAIP